MTKFFKIKFAVLEMIFLFTLTAYSDTPPSNGEPVVKISNSQNIEKQIPLRSKEKWYILKYDFLPANHVTFSDNGLSIKVDKSASPLIYPLTKDPILVEKVSIAGHVDKLVSIKNPDQQGQKGFDDFNLRFGLVLLGSKRLSWLKRQLASKWIVEMPILLRKIRG